MEILGFVILVLSLLNLIRLASFMIGADMYEVRQMQTPKSKKAYHPHLTVIIPAHNEESGVIRTVESVLANDYKNKKIVVVDDGSLDSTYYMLCDFQAAHPEAPLTVVHQMNKGKATAINNALKNHTAGSPLVMVLDADSLLHPQAISRIVAHFRDERVVAAAANVKIIDGKNLLTVAQRLEYVISHRIKRGLTTLNMEYIIGGVGSTFRKRMIKRCDYYDTDTMTEDIDFTLKMIMREGNRDNRVIFAADAVAYTEGVTRFGSLVRQRFRWKFGRMQTFVKNRKLFFSRDKKHGKMLSWVYLPFVVFSELILLFDPILTLIVLYMTITVSGWSGFAVVYGVISAFALLNILGETTEPWRRKLKLITLVPVAYWLLILMSLIDFIVLVQSLLKIRALLTRSLAQSHWQSPERTGGAVKV